MSEVSQFEVETRWEYQKASIMAALIVDNPDFIEALELTGDAIDVHRQRYSRSVDELEQRSDPLVNEEDPLSHLENERIKLSFQLSMIEFEIDFVTSVDEERQVVVDVSNELTATASELYDTDPANYAQWAVEDFADLVSEVHGIKVQMNACDRGIQSVSRRHQVTDGWFKNEFNIDSAHIQIVCSDIITAFRTIFPEAIDQKLVSDKIRKDYDELARDLYDYSPREVARRLKEITSSWKAVAEERRIALLDELTDIYGTGDEKTTSSS